LQGNTWSRSSSLWSSAERERPLSSLVILHVEMPIEVPFRAFVLPSSVARSALSVTPSRTLYQRRRWPETVVMRASLAPAEEAPSYSENSSRCVRANLDFTWWKRDVKRISAFAAFVVQHSTTAAGNHHSVVCPRATNTSLTMSCPRCDS